MASKTQTDERSERVASMVDALTALTEQAEQVKDAPQPVTDFTKAIGKLTGYVDGMNGSAAAVVEALVVKGHAELWQSTLADLRLIQSTLTATGEGPSREEGDALAKKLSAIATVPELLADGEAETFTALCERWSKSSPKKPTGSSSGSSSSQVIAPLGFTVKVRCQKQGCDFAASTGQDNLNSIRRQAQVHSDKKHGQPIVSGQPLHTGLTEALAKVGMTSSKFEVGKADAAEGGGFTVTR